MSTICWLELLKYKDMVFFFAIFELNEMNEGLFGCRLLFGQKHQLEEEILAWGNRDNNFFLTFYTLCIICVASSAFS